MPLADTSNTHKRDRKSGATPACQIVADAVRSHVRAGNLPPGTRMPSHRQLATEHGVALGTVQQAVARLVSEGVLETQANRGLYVARARRQAEQSWPIDTYRPGSSIPVVAAHIGIISPLATLWDETQTKRIQDPAEPLPPTIGALERAIGECGGSTAFRDTGGHPEDQLEFTRRAVRDLLDQGIDALALVIVPDDIIMSAVLTQVDTSRVPVVLAVSERCRVPLPRVCYDGRIAALKAAQHLLSQGCRRLVYFAPFHAEWSADRLEGVRDAARLSGRGDGTVVAVEGEGVLQYIYDLGEQRELAADLAVANLPDLIGNDVPGIVAHNDHAAIGFIKAADALGYRAGYDYLIIGFDDHSDSRNLGLSSMRPPFGDMGRECAKLLLETLTSPLTGPKQVSLHSHLVVRESSRKCINSGGISHDTH